MDQALGSFIQARKKLTGGFSATPMLPATIQDTYHALRILALLNKQGEDTLSDGALRYYLTNSGNVGHNAKVTFQRLACCQMIGEDVPDQPILDFVRRRLAETNVLEERYYCCRLILEIVGRGHAEFNWLPTPVTDWSFRTASELWMLLYLADQKPGNDAVLTSWLKECQTGDGGFGFFPGTTSFLENCYDCLRALRRLGSLPRYPHACRDFVLACRTNNGGFARCNGGAAFLSSTWQAVATLNILKVDSLGQTA